MGARLVAASLPIYALGVAIALFLWRQPDPHSMSWFWALWYGGLIALAALAILLAGGATARSIAIVAIVPALVVVFVVGRGLAGDPGPFYLAFYLLWFLGVVSFPGYLAAYRALQALEPDVASAALARAALFATAVVLALVVLGPRYWPESTSDRIAVVITTASIVALGGATALLVGVSGPRLSPRGARLALGIVAVIQVVVFVRGLPNVPMAVASVPPLALEYPADRPDLAADATRYSERLALFVRRSGAVLPVNGVYVRYRWYFGPDDPAPPAGVALVTLSADLMDWPGRIDAFAVEASRTLVPPPDSRLPGAYSPWRGFITWARTSDTPESDAQLAKLCDLLVNNKSTPELDRAPYLRAERDAGVEAARSLYARSMQSQLKDWDALVRGACLSFLAG
jgi:hypothetical protein